jgi:hypothetical protein
MAFIGRAANIILPTRNHETGKEIHELSDHAMAAKESSATIHLR